MDGYYITISNGLLKDNHELRMLPTPDHNPDYRTGIKLRFFLPCGKRVLTAFLKTAILYLTE